MYKSAEKRLKLAKAIFVGPDDESDKAGNVDDDNEIRAVFNWVL